MKKERQIGIMVGLSAFFALELEDVYQHTSGAHRALAFPDFLGLLVGLGLEAYRKQNAPEAQQEEAPEDGGTADPLHLFDLDRHGLHDLFRDFDDAMEPPEEGPRLRLVHAGDTA